MQNQKCLLPFYITNNELKEILSKNIFPCLFNVYNTISLSRHEQICLMMIHFGDIFSIRSLINRTFS